MAGDRVTVGVRVRRSPPPGLGPMLAAARIRAGYGVRAAERLAGVGHPYVLRIEAGLRVPSVTVARVLAELLDLDAEERALLFGAAVDDAGRGSWERRARQISSAERSESVVP